MHRTIARKTIILIGRHKHQTSQKFHLPVLHQTSLIHRCFTTFTPIPQTVSLEKDTELLYQFQSKYNELLSSNNFDACKQLLVEANGALERRPILSSDGRFSVTCFKVVLLRNTALLSLVCTDYDQADEITRELMGMKDVLSSDNNGWDRYFFYDLNSALSIIAKCNVQLNRLNEALSIQNWIVKRLEQQLLLLEQMENTRQPDDLSIQDWIDKTQNDLTQEKQNQKLITAKYNEQSHV